MREKETYMPQLTSHKPALGMHCICHNLPSTNMLRREHSWDVKEITCLHKTYLMSISASCSGLKKRMELHTMKLGCIPSEIIKPPLVVR